MPISTLWGAKVRIIFEMTKNYAIFKRKMVDFLYFIRNFAPQKCNLCRNNYHKFK